MISAFISAIDSFAKQFSNNELEKLVLKDDVFSFSKIKDVIFVFTHEDIKNSKLKSLSNRISREFFKRYDSELKNWDNDILKFESFKEELDKMIVSNGKSTLLEMEKFLQNQKMIRLDQKK